MYLFIDETAHKQLISKLKCNKTELRNPKTMRLTSLRIHMVDHL